MEKTPYVHAYTDGLEAMQLLARGSNAVVFLTIGLAMPEGGADEDEIARYTGLSIQTVRKTLTNLRSAGLIETSGGDYVTAKYIEYRKPVKNYFSPGIDQSINLQSNQSSSSIKKLSTEKEFGLALRGLADAITLSGGGSMNASEYEKFKELWDDVPDAATHTRALAITVKKATRPNFRYYDAVVRTGAVDYDAAKNPDVVEVTL